MLGQKIGCYSMAHDTSAIDADAANLPAYRSRGEIFAHPEFRRARNSMVDALLGLYEP